MSTENGINVVRDVGVATAGGRCCAESAEAVARAEALRGHFGARAERDTHRCVAALGIIGLRLCLRHFCSASTRHSHEQRARHPVAAVARDRRDELPVGSVRVGRPHLRHLEPVVRRVLTPARQQSDCRIEGKSTRI